MTLLTQHVWEAHLDGAGQDVVLHDLCAKALVLEQAVKIEAELLQSGVDGVVGGQEHGDPVDLIAQDVCNWQSHLIFCKKNWTRKCTQEAFECLLVARSGLFSLCVLSARARVGGDGPMGTN